MVPLPGFLDCSVYLQYQTDWSGPEADTEQQVQLEAERNFQDTAVTSDNKVKYVRLIDWRKNNLAVSEEKET